MHPYVYRVDNPETGEFYIGSRFANKVSAVEDLGRLYFTSSRYIKPRFNEFQYQVIAEFFDRDSAYDFEQKLINENWNDPKILNKSCQYGKKQWKNDGGYKDSDTHRANKSAAMKKYYESDAARKKKREEQLKRYEKSEEHEKQRLGNLKRYSRPVERERAKELGKKRRELISMIMKNLWKNKEYRLKQKISRNKRMFERNN